MILTITPAPVANAGSDEAICEGDVFDLSSSVTIPTASNYSTLSWSSSGTGTFDDNSSLTPDYTPSAADITAGSVTLTLQANGNGSCATPATDNMIITTTPAPVTNAGNEAAI